jgi:hypothetical protein
LSAAAADAIRCGVRHNWRATARRMNGVLPDKFQYAFAQVI